ncbi:MAG: hypothetical protein ACREBR_02110, partial [bacterium]
FRAIVSTCLKRKLGLHNLCNNWEQQIGRGEIMTRLLRYSYRESCYKQDPYFHTSFHTIRISPHILLHD